MSLFKYQRAARVFFSVCLHTIVCHFPLLKEESLIHTHTNGAGDAGDEIPESVYTAPALFQRLLCISILRLIARKLFLTSSERREEGHLAVLL